MGRGGEGRGRGGKGEGRGGKGEGREGGGEGREGGGEGRGREREGEGEGRGRGGRGEGKERGGGGRGGRERGIKGEKEKDVNAHITRLNNTYLHPWSDRLKCETVHKLQLLTSSHLHRKWRCGRGNTKGRRGLIVSCHLDSKELSFPRTLDLM